MAAVHAAWSVHRPRKQRSQSRRVAMSDVHEIIVFRAWMLMRLGASLVFRSPKHDSRSATWTLVTESVVIERLRAGTRSKRGEWTP
uniref:Transposase n=1 Tax=Steinernema glaseri TaxID=37863 RepID=A0A1I7Z6R2_9BILA